MKKSHTSLVALFTPLPRSSAALYPQALLVRAVPPPPPP